MTTPDTFTPEVKKAIEESRANTARGVSWKTFKESTPDILEAAERDELVTRREDFEGWRNAIMACALGRHTPNRKVKISGWSITTCACGGSVHASEGQGGPHVP